MSVPTCLCREGSSTQTTPFGPLVSTLRKRELTGLTLDFFCSGVDGGRCFNLFPSRHSSKRDKGKQKRSKKPPKQPVSVDWNDNAHISEIGEGGQPTIGGTEDGVKADDNVLLQVFRSEIAYFSSISVFYSGFIQLRESEGSTATYFLVRIHGAPFTSLLVLF